MGNKYFSIFYLIYLIKKIENNFNVKKLSYY